ncbi:MAG TPA: response regulator transcription factor [Bacteroidia bacterium]|jgi:DNA-binding LytR/AlgR family response regulator|nr:response regulator transcription factor [Bacteroidia bacterium]
MNKKLRCVIVDDYEKALNRLQDLCVESSYVEVIKSFDCPRQFLDACTSLDFDIVFLDIHLPKVHGFTVAKILNDIGKAIIFVTSDHGYVPEALAFSPIDVLLKPIHEERFDIVCKKAYQLLRGLTNEVLLERKKHEIFNVAEKPGKVKVLIADIVYVKTDRDYPRNKQILTREGKKFTILNYTMEDILDIAPHLVQANASELISKDSFEEIDHELIILKGINGQDGKVRKVYLSRTYKKEFIHKVSFA